MEFLTKNADTALVEIKEELYERLTEIRRIRHDFRDRINEDLWYGITTQCSNEEQFLSGLLDKIERS